MAHALPVVVRHLPGVNDSFVRDGTTGLLFTNGEEYVRQVSRLLTDRVLREEIGCRAQELVRITFDMCEVARKYLTLYGFPAVAEKAERTAANVAAVLRLRTTGSIIDPDFHVIAELGEDPIPKLLTMADAEEAFDWGLPFSRDETDVSSMRHQQKAHRIFQRYGVIPTYMVDYPIATQDGGRGPLRDFLQSGECDVGAQLHPWVSPPFLERVTTPNSFPGNLPPGLEFEKIRRLTETIEQELGVRPQVYRAGRYGAGRRTADILKSLGYLADSSVMPCWDFSGQGGPNYAALSAVPRWVDSDRTLLELPCAAAVVGSGGACTPLRRLVYSSPAEHLGIPALTARFGLLERIKLTPEGIAIHEAKRLVRHMLARGHRIFVMTYHTPSMVPGNTPYVRNEADLDRFLRWLEEFYDFFTHEIGGQCSTWRQVHEMASSARGMNRSGPIRLPA